MPKKIMNYMTKNIFENITIKLLLTLVTDMTMDPMLTYLRSNSVLSIEVKAHYSICSITMAEAEDLG